MKGIKEGARMVWKEAEEQIRESETNPHIL